MHLILINLLYFEYKIKKAFAYDDTIVDHLKIPEPSAPFMDDDDYIDFEETKPSAPPLANDDTMNLPEAVLLYGVIGDNY